MCIMLGATSPSSLRKWSLKPWAGMPAVFWPWEKPRRPARCLGLTARAPGDRPWPNPVHPIILCIDYCRTHCCELFRCVHVSGESFMRARVLQGLWYGGFSSVFVLSLHTSGLDMISRNLCFLQPLLVCLQAPQKLGLPTEWGVSLVRCCRPRCF